MCSRFLTSGVKLKVDYCAGKTGYTYVDQSVNGGQWNILGALPFFKGHMGRITVNHGGQPKSCKQGGKGCIWLADAYRVRLVSSDSKNCRIPAEYYNKATTTLEATTTEETTTTEAPTTTVDKAL